MDDIAQQLLLRVSQRLPGIIEQLLQNGFNPDDESLQLECSLISDASRTPASRVPVASIRIDHQDITPSSSTTISRDPVANPLPPIRGVEHPRAIDWNARSQQTSTDPLPIWTIEHTQAHPPKRRKHNISGSGDTVANDANITNGASKVLQRQKRTPDNPVLQPSTLEKFIGGVWESLYSEMKMDPTEVIEQWQAIESSGQSRLLTDTEREIATRNDTGTFARMNVLARKISQVSRTCRSLEVIVQAHWVQCFDDRVAELAQGDSGESAKKTALAEACLDFHWSEKELRNRMAIWRGYHDIKNAGGWAALVFAGMGLYRFCKYRGSSTEDTLQTLRGLRHRFEVAADTLHPRWRSLLGIIDGPTEPQYTGHPHDWVVSAPGHTALPLPQTYRQWDSNFAYRHLDQSELDAEAWGEFDPRTVLPPTDAASTECQKCGERQSDDPRENMCACFPTLYGGTKVGAMPVQVFRTPNGKNNGLLACCAFEQGAAVGEFVGQITAGIEGLDVMVGQTERASYQIWQGKAGNYTRFVNHSCQPNGQFERFIWLGTQRIVLVSKGIAAGEEVTVDYSDTYWQNLDKRCLCERPNCRYQNRVESLVVLPSPREDAESEWSR